MIRLLPICLAVLMSGCALPSFKPASVARPAQLESAAFTLNGRISVKQRGKRDSATLRWVHGGASDEILLFSPLGQTVARVYRNDQTATLENGDGHHHAHDAETLMDQVLGWRLPLGSLQRWVLGLPDSNGSAEIKRDDKGRIDMLRQANWEVRYLSYADNGPGSLPSRLQLSHDGLQMQLLIDGWEWDPQ